MSDRDKGFYHKFNIARVDGTDKRGGKHDGCEYFILDLTHDLHALAAIEAYAKSCAGDFPKLTADLMAKALTIRGARRSAFDLIRAIEHVLDSESLSNEDRGRLSFALAKVAQFEN